MTQALRLSTGTENLCHFLPATWLEEKEIAVFIFWT